MKKIAYTLLFGSIILIIFFLIMQFQSAVIPAYMSVKFDCPTKSIQELENETGYIVMGTFEVKNNTQTITVHDSDPVILNHELCHQKQFEKGMLFGCEHKVLLFISELQCYLED